MPLYPRQNHIAHLGQNKIVRPAAFADKMQQRLVLRRRPFRGRQGGHRLASLHPLIHPDPNVARLRRRKCFLSSDACRRFQSNTAAERLSSMPDMVASITA